jgi:hypothetical protein
MTGVRHSRRGTIDGEYIDGGHTFPDAIPPRWIWVWD